MCVLGLALEELVESFDLAALRREGRVDVRCGTRRNQRTPGFLSFGERPTALHVAV